MTPSGTRGVLNDAVSIHFPDAALAGAFVSRWCIGYKVETPEEHLGCVRMNRRSGLRRGCPERRDTTVSRYGDEATAEGTKRAEELAADGDLGACGFGARYRRNQAARDHSAVRVRTLEGGGSRGRTRGSPDP